MATKKKTEQFTFKLAADTLPNDRQSRRVRYEYELWWSIERLAYLRAEMESLPSQRRTPEVEVYRILYHLENYLIRVYEIRERALGLLAEVVDQSVEGLRHPARRAATASALTAGARRPLELRLQLQDLLDQDIGTRNLHTHETFVRLEVCSSTGAPRGDNVLDIFADLAKDERRFLTDKDRDLIRGYKRMLRRGARRLAGKYKVKIKAVESVASRFLKAVKGQ
jgi:hypothetical protein